MTVFGGITELPPICTIGWPISLSVNRAVLDARTLLATLVPSLNWAGGVTRDGSENARLLELSAAGADSVTLLQVVAPAGQLAAKPLIVTLVPITPRPSNSKIGWLKSAAVKNAEFDVSVMDPELIAPS
jgi:hypothetical protein